ncbi:MAG: hypothetical protein KC589_10505, partial [Nanoarchaeota archaeon]|nr:hypothetical protein [Nanoarchaeota archaeon]
MNNVYELYLNDIGYVELSSDVSIPIIYNISNYDDISQRRSNFSKTISVLGTPNNNKIFEHVWDVKSSGSFKMNYKHPCKLLSNRNPLITGYLILNKVKKLLVGDKEQIIYELNIIDEVKSLFDDLGEKTLNELSFVSFSYNGINYPSGNHTLEPLTVLNSLNNTYEDAYSYTINSNMFLNILYNANNFIHKAPFNHTILYPAFYVKYLFDNIMYDNDINYESDYLDGTTYNGFFTKLVDVYNKSNIVDTVVSEITRGPKTIYYSNTEVSLYSNTGHTISGNTIYSYDLSGFIASQLPSSTTYGYYFNRGGCDGVYKIKLKLDSNTDNAGTSTGGCPTAGLSDTKYSVYLVSGNNTTSILTKYTSDINIGSYNEFESDEFEVNDYDYIYFSIKPGTINYYDPVDGCEEITADDISINGASITIIKNNLNERDDDNNLYPIKLEENIFNSSLHDMKQKDFLKNQIKLANLYIDYDKNKNKFIIEPRDDFYLKGSIIEWTDKVDHNKEIVIKPLPSEQSSGYKFSFNEYDNDYWLDYISWAGNYDDYLTSNANNINEVNIGYEKYYNTWSFYTPTIPPTIKEQVYSLQVDKDVSNYSPTKSSFMDKKSSRGPMLSFIDRDRIDGIYTIYSGNTNTQISTGYTCSSFLTHVGTGRTDMLFWKLFGFGFVGSYYTDYDNPYSYFYERNITNLLSYDNKLVEMYLKLDDSDIINLDFKNRIIIDNQLYFLERVEYDPTKTSHKVILQKQVKPLGNDGSFV